MQCDVQKIFQPACTLPSSEKLRAKTKNERRRTRRDVDAVTNAVRVRERVEEAEADAGGRLVHHAVRARPLHVASGDRVERVGLRRAEVGCGEVSRRAPSNPMRVGGRGREDDVNSLKNGMKM